MIELFDKNDLPKPLFSQFSGGFNLTVFSTKTLGLSPEKSGQNKTMEKTVRMIKTNTNITQSGIEKATGLLRRGVE